MKDLNKLKEIDYTKLEKFGKLTNSEGDLSQIQFINKEKSSAINKKFSIRR